MVTSDEVGRALYHFIKAGGLDGNALQLSQEVPEVFGERRTEIRRITRALPDGSIEIVEQVITDERIY